MLKVVAHKIAVRPFTTEEKSEGGIIIPDTSRKVLFSGVVTIAGRDVDQIKVGDVVHYLEEEVDRATDEEGKSIHVVLEKNVVGIVD